MSSLVMERDSTGDLIRIALENKDDVLIEVEGNELDDLLESKKISDDDAEGIRKRLQKMLDEEDPDEGLDDDAHDDLDLLEDDFDDNDFDDDDDQDPDYNDDEDDEDDDDADFEEEED